MLRTPRLPALLCRLAGLTMMLGLAVAPAARAGSGSSAPATLTAAPAPRPPAMKRQQPAPSAASVIETTADLSNALTVKSPRSFSAAPAPGSALIQVDPAVTYQHVVGFGGAMTDTAAWLLETQLSPQARTSVMDALFGPQGIHLGFLRIPMGATDFTAHGVPYTYDDLPPGQTDPTLAHFSIAHDQPYILPALKQMLSINPDVFTLANPWTPPPWMKSNNAYDNVGLAGTVLPQFYPALAQYFVKFIQAYQAQGVPIKAITMMNEPDSPSPWPGAAFYASDQAQWLPQDLRPALDAARLHPAVYGLDDTSLTDAQTLLQSPATADVKGIAFHCYRGLGSLSALQAAYPSKDIIESECSPGIVHYSTAEVAIDATRNWASAVQLWNLALDPSGGPVQPPDFGCPHCTGVVTVSEQTRTASLGRNYYELGQLSRYVLPGAVRIASTRLVSDVANISEVTPGVDDVAFANRDGSTVLVAYNSLPTPAPVAVEYKGRYLNWTMRSRSTVTFTWR